MDFNLICAMLIAYPLHCSFVIGSAYAYFYDFHLTTYGDAVLLAVQCKCYCLGNAFN